jgi:hypothetical protein
MEEQDPSKGCRLAISAKLETESPASSLSDPKIEMLTVLVLAIPPVKSEVETFRRLKPDRPGNFNLSLAATLTAGSVSAGGIKWTRPIVSNKSLILKPVA